jgi:hypothetical protein
MHADYLNAYHHVVDDVVQRALDAGLVAEGVVDAVIARLQELRNGEGSCPDGCMFHSHGPRPSVVYTVTDCGQYGDSDAIVGICYSKSAAELLANHFRKEHPDADVDVDERPIR